MGNEMKNCYFLGRLSFSILGFLLHAPQEIESMEKDLDISMVSSSSKSSLGAESEQHLKFGGEEYPISKKRGLAPLQIKDISNTNSMSSMDCCSLSPGKSHNLSPSDSLEEKPREHSFDDKLEVMISSDGFVEACNVFAFWTSGSCKFTQIKVRGIMSNEDIAKLCTWKSPTSLKEVNWGQTMGIPLFFQQILRCHWDQSLRVLDLIDEDVKGPVSGYIALALAKNQSLTALNVHLNRKSVQGDWIKAIVDPLIDHKALKTIDLSRSWIGGFGDAIAKVFVGNKTVTEFKFSHCALLNMDVSVILQALRENKTLTGLDLSGNQLGVWGAEKITEVLIQNPLSMNSSTMFPSVHYQPQFVKDLNLGGNDIGDKGAEWIATILANNTVLTALNLSQNKIGPVGVHYLVDALVNNTTLTKLSLGDNQIAEGVQYIVKPLNKNKTKFKNTTLTILDLHNNNIGKSSVKHIVKFLTENTSLTEYNVSKNKFNAQDSMKIIAALSKNNTLTMLNLGFYGITMKDAPDISKTLRKNSTLRVLDLGEETPEDVRESINSLLALNKK